MANDLEKKIIHQIEYYFGDFNLSRDKFLQEKIKEDDGWVTLKVLTTFKRLADLSTDEEVIATALEKSENKVALVSEDKKKVRRNPDKPLPELNEERKKELMAKSAYAKGFPREENLADIINFLEPYGPIETCIRRIDKEHRFKGSCFIVFKDLETCKKFIEQESVKYKDTELIRKWQNDYLAEKKKEIEERKKSKKEKKVNNSDEKIEKTPEFPKGVFLHFSGIEDGQSLTREEIKEKFKEHTNIEVSYVDFKKGDLEGYARLPAENDALEFCKKLTDGSFAIGKINLKIRALEGQEEEEYVQKTAEAVVKNRQKNRLAGRNNRKRKGNFGNHNNRESKQKRGD